MVLWDGSTHHWFGPDHPPCCLLVAMDDATGAILVARFFPFEGSEGYLWLLQEVVRGYGIPVSLYHDRHGSLHRNDDHWTLEEQLAGRQEPTQGGEALEALGIHSIRALSPQAKGRIERLFRTLQDRLGAELKLVGITTPGTANAFLTGFRKTFNRRFAVSPKEAEPAWRKVTEGLDLDRVISFRYSATVGLDNTVRWGRIDPGYSAGSKPSLLCKSQGGSPAALGWLLESLLPGPTYWETSLNYADGAHPGSSQKEVSSQRGQRGYLGLSGLSTPNLKLWNPNIHKGDILTLL